MKLGYNTNGFAHHRLEDCLDILEEIGYEAVGFTVDVHHPYRPGLFDGRRLLPVVETGARFLLDARKKHQPTLMNDDGRRRDFLFRCIDIAAEIGAPCVSLWSGAGDDWDTLADALRPVCDRAEEAGVDIAFEPEPGMLVDTMAAFDELEKHLGHPRFKLTLDVGHVHCLEEESPARVLELYKDLLVNVHLDDHRKGVHEHLFFGDGEIDFDPVKKALSELDVPAIVELSRHSADAVATARRAFEFFS